MFLLRIPNPFRRTKKHVVADVPDIPANVDDDGRGSEPSEGRRSNENGSGCTSPDSNDESDAFGETPSGSTHRSGPSPPSASARHTDPRHTDPKMSSNSFSSSYNGRHQDPKHTGSAESSTSYGYSRHQDAKHSNAPSTSVSKISFSSTISSVISGSGSRHRFSRISGTSRTSGISRTSATSQDFSQQPSNVSMQSHGTVCSATSQQSSRSSGGSSLKRQCMSLLERYLDNTWSRRTSLGSPPSFSRDGSRHDTGQSTGSRSSKRMHSRGGSRHDSRCDTRQPTISEDGPVEVMENVFTIREDLQEVEKEVRKTQIEMEGSETLAQPEESERDADRTPSATRSMIDKWKKRRQDKKDKRKNNEQRNGKATYGDFVKGCFGKEDHKTVNDDNSSPS